MADRVQASSLVALVTGASAGFGHAIATRLLREGAKVIAAGRRAERLEELRSAWPGTCHIAVMDVRDRAAVDASLAALPADFHAVDVLVNNAGLARGLAPAHESSWEDWEEMIDTNVKALAYVTRVVLPGMVARGRGHVVNIGSVAGTYAYPGGNVYGATKAFVEQLSLGLLADLVKTPLRVTNVEPGLAETEFSVVRFHGDEDRAKAVYRGTQPLTAEDVAEAVFWCVTLPRHVNVSRLELLPTCQAPGPMAVHRDG